MMEELFIGARNASNEVGGLMEALAKSQAEFPPIPKNSSVKYADRGGGMINFRYADLDTILQHTRPILSRNGIAVIQYFDSAGGLDFLVTRLSWKDQWIEGRLRIVCESTKPQDLGAVVTYMRRYSLSAMLGVTADEDDDAVSVAAPQRSASQSRSQSLSPPAARAPVQAQPGPEQTLGVPTAVKIREKMKSMGWTQSRFLELMTQAGAWELIAHYPTDFAAWPQEVRPFLNKVFDAGTPVQAAETLLDYIQKNFAHETRAIKLMDDDCKDPLEMYERMKASNRWPSEADALQALRSGSAMFPNGDVMPF